MNQDKMDEGFTSKWKKGIDKITTVQQLKVQIYSTAIMLIGIIAGIIVMIYFIDKYWWGLIILIGAFGNTAIQMLGIIQKYRLFKKIQNGGLNEQ